MQLIYNVTGAEKKKLVQTLSEILCVKAEYLFAPSFSHKVGDFIITKEGAILTENEVDTKLIKTIVEKLAEQGFVANIEKTNGILEEQVIEKLVVELPIESYTENLEKLVESKSELIKKALKSENLEIIKSEDRISFPWFSGEIDAETLKAYTLFITKLCELAKGLKRVNGKQSAEIENEKYAFRCFLLRLGFIGAEYKEERKILLQNFEGSSAFKGGNQNEISE